MYYVRIVFFIKSDYDIDLDEETVLFEKDGVKCKSEIDRKFDEVKVILTYGEFEKEDVAEEEGKKLFYSVKKQFIRKEIPINISGGLGVLDTTQESFNTGGLTEYGLDNIHHVFPQLKGETVRNEVLGMKVYELDEDISEVKFISQNIDTVLKKKMPEINIEEYKNDDNLNIAYSLLNSSNSINDIRASFLLKISAIESLVSEDAYKEQNYCKVINFLNKNAIKFDNVKEALNLSNDRLKEIIHKIKSSFGKMKKKSIGEKCKGIINDAQLQREYLGMNAIDFFNECYKIRSNFVHSGTYKVDKNETSRIRELENYLRELNNLVLDILDYYESNV